jgi:sugar phosphate isomerase/epimerase
MMNRREFMGGVAGAAAAAAVLDPRTLWAAEGKLGKIGMQLYTVRDAMKADMEGTLAKVAAIGYQEVEFAGYFDHSAKGRKAMLERHGLSSPSSHIPYETLGDKWAKTLDDAKGVGNSYIVCPWIPEELRNSADGRKQVYATFNKAAEAAKMAGLQFGYHNHNFEFAVKDGKMFYDELLANTDAKMVKMEMDLCWASVGGADPVAYFNKYPGRFPLVHVKDMKKLPEKGSALATGSPGDVESDMTDVGSGIIDWKRIFAAADKGGIKHYFVEHDNPKDAWASLKSSYGYLRGMRVG